MSKGSKRRLGKDFESNFDKIFGDKKSRDAKWADQKVKKAEVRTRTRGEFKEFISPIDQTVISCPSKLRAHNKKHGVTNIRDYGEGWFERKHTERSDEITGNTRQAHKERIENVKESLQRHGVYKP